MGDRCFVIRPAASSDMPGVARLFRSCFSRSYESYPGASRVSDAAMIDIFEFLRCEEPGGFWVAAGGEAIVGYSITPRSMRRLWGRAIAGGHIFRWLWAWLRGRYGLSIISAFLIVLDKCIFAISPHNYRRRGDAQVLSVAVAPDHRGKGIAAELLSKGLEYLAGLGIPEIKLEVRPDNIAAQRLYEQLKFKVVGEMPDRRGGWVVMAKDLGPVSTSDTVHRG